MPSLVGGIKGERGHQGPRVCVSTQPRVDNVTVRWPQNPLNFSVRIRRLGAAPSAENGPLAWERVRQADRRGRRQQT